MSDRSSLERQQCCVKSRLLYYGIDVYGKNTSTYTWFTEKHSITDEHVLLKIGLNNRSPIVGGMLKKRLIFRGKSPNWRIHRTQKSDMKLLCNGEYSWDLRWRYAE